MLVRLDLRAWPWLLACVVGAAGLGLVAVRAPLVALAATIGVAFVVLAFADLTVGVVLLTTVAFLEVLPGVSGISAAKLIGAVLLLSWFAASTAGPVRPQLHRARPGFMVLLAVYVGWVALGVVWAASPGNVVTAITRYVPNLLLLPVLYTAVRTRRDLWLIVGAFVAGALLSGLYGAVAGTSDPDLPEGRVSGAGIDPNYLAAFAVAAIVLSAGVAANRAVKPVLRWSSAAVAAALMVVLISTASRTGIAALIACALAAVAFAGRGRRVPAILLGVVLLGGGAAYVARAAPPAVRDRLSASAVGDGSGRTDIWKVGVRMARANMLHGVGAANFPVVSREYLLVPGNLNRDNFILDDPKVAHNIYLGAWAELGVPGLLLILTIFAVLVGCAIRAAWTFDASGERSLALLSRSLAVAMVGLLTAGMFVSFEYQKTIWLLLGLGPAVLGLARRQAAS